MSIVRTGSTKKYSDGWETAFGKKKRAARKSAAPKKRTKKAKKKK